MIDTILKKLKNQLLARKLNSGKSTSKRPLQIDQQNITLSRRRLDEFLMYSDFEKDTMYMANGGELLIGFGFELGSLTQAHDTAATKLENLYKGAIEDTVVQFMEIGRDNIRPFTRAWQHRQNKYNQNELLKKMNGYRVGMLEQSTKTPLHKPSNMFLRRIERYVFLTFHFKGSIDVKDDLTKFVNQVEDYKESVKGTLSDANLSPSILDRKRSINVIKGLCNPHLSAETLSELDSDDINIELSSAVTVKNTNMQVQENGDIEFSSTGDDTLQAVHLTLDKTPQELRINKVGELTGDMLNRDFRINRPYCFYTTVHVPNAALAKESVEKSLGWLSKQSVSSSPAMKDMLPHIYQRKEDSKEFITELSKGQIPIRTYSGIIIYCEPATATMEADQLISNWSNKGFVISRERHISFPMWQASLPWQYRYFWDEPRAGLMRARVAKSINAASMSIVEGDWTGNVPILKEDENKEKYTYLTGVPVVSGRGNISFIDIFSSESNYNFTVIATSGAGKSFWANDLVRDVRSRNGLVFIFDMGGSYRDFCEIMEGTNLDFPISEPFSINHFWGIDTKKEFNETFPILYSSIVAMAFETGEPDPYQLKLIQNGLREAWDKHQGKLGVKEIYETYKNNEDIELQKIGTQLQNYAMGTQSIWFNGEPQVDLSNAFTILELNELQNDPALKTVVFTTIIALVTRKIYSADRSIPKLLLIDEAWSLLDDERAAPFIEQAFRTIRKFFGAAGIITQSCEDIDMSSAAKAAFTNSSWRFFLLQKSSSVAYARDKELLPSSGGHIFDVMSSLRRRDNFSEVLVEHDGMYAPFRFFVDPYSAFVYSSKPQDNIQVMRIKDENNISKDEAIEVASGLKTLEEVLDTKLEEAV